MSTTTYGLCFWSKTSSSFDEHLAILEEVLHRFKDANLTINLERCEFFRKFLRYLSFVIDGNGLETDLEKISVIINYPRPTSTTEVKRFAGMTSWYRKFISHYSTLVAPLDDLIKGKKE